MQLKEKRDKIFIRCGRGDMRREIDGLSCIVAESPGEAVLFDESAVFLLCGRKKDRYKVLKWEGEDFSLSYRT